jgi:hypothetical protein
MKQFNIVLRGPEILSASTSRVDASSYTAEQHNVGSILVDICEALGELPGVSFIVEGFERRPWPVMVRPDLAILLEQLPELLGDLDRGSAELDLFEQGVERAVQITRLDATLSLEYRGMRSEGELVEQTVPLASLLDMFEVLVEEFLRISVQRCPELLRHPWLGEWSRSVEERLSRLRTSST